MRAFIRKNLMKLVKFWIGAGLTLFFILYFSSSTYIFYFKSPAGYPESIQYLSSFYIFHPELKDYYTALEKDTSFYRLVLSQLKGKERAYFLQMRPFLSEIAKASQKTGVPIFSIASHIKRESQFNPFAISPRGAYGLMGVTIWAYQDVMRLKDKKKWVAEALNEYGDFGWKEVKTNPELNIVVGAIYYKFLLDKFKDTTLASLAYNWGIGNVTLMQERYGNTENILARLNELASFNSAWVEPAKYPWYISNFEAVFQKVEKRIKMVYAPSHQLNWQNLASLNLPQEKSSS
ncbi:hypothetical protein DRJ04_06935 [Candidatus Aerophobetes bacterium]|uniref:Transglycosylase SLT domain-containing protein n=1 Tax=Aerophobetes bacterium TaxID=2030807 RepID=A0A662D994_UNCAE|nr:MAG: hypothetical protein DRJ04_06935 [Candidatus Aerophobetes bacterium]